MALPVGYHQGDREGMMPGYPQFLLVWCRDHLFDAWDEDGPFGIDELGQEQDQIGHRLVD